jgi:hypothetical protein
MTYDLNNTTLYTVWMCYADKPDEVYATNLSEWDADMVVNEMNSIDDSADYRYCPVADTPAEEYFEVQEALAKEFSDNLHRFQTGTF